MRVEHLISAVNAEPHNLISKMNITADAVLINQCGNNSEETFSTDSGMVRVYSYNERGVGLSRNRAIEHSSGDILLFADDDIVYSDGYEEVIISEFEKHPEADGLFFNVKVCEDRRTYFNDDYKRCHIWNAGRYPAYSIAVRKTSFDGKGVRFSTLFGGGAKYSCGEDSIFIKDCLKAGLHMYRTPALIGEEVQRPSTWFNGYDEKFFFDRGVMYHFLYGKLAKVFGARFVFSKRKEMCQEIPAKRAYRLLLDGIKEGKGLTNE